MEAGIDVSDVSREENWLPIKDFDGLYEVSDLGRVRSVDRLVPHGVGNRYGIGPDGRMRHRRGRVIVAKAAKTGHQRLTLSKMGIHTTHSVHVLVKHTFDGPVPPGRIVCHDNGNASDNRLENLYWGTHEQNALDKERHGTNHQLNKSRCPRKHLYAGPNLIANMGNKRVGGPGPQRNCRACDNARCTRGYRRRQGLPELDFDTVADACYEKIMCGEMER